MSGNPNKRQARACAYIMVEEQFKRFMEKPDLDKLFRLVTLGRDYIKEMTE